VIVPVSNRQRGQSLDRRRRRQEPDRRDRFRDGHDHRPEMVPRRKPRLLHVRRG